MKHSRHLKDTVADPNTGEVICKCCGTVIQEKTAEQSRPSSFDNDKAIHYGNTTQARHDLGLSTIIGKSQSDFAGDAITVNNQQLFFKLRRLDRMSPSNWNASKGRRLSTLLKSLELVCGIMMVPDPIKKECIELLRKINKAGLAEKRRTKTFVAATVYVVCKQANYVRPSEDFVKKLDIESITFRKYVKLISEEFQLKTHNENTTFAILYKNANTLELPRNITAKAQEIIELCSKRGITAGLKPTVVAASALYVAVLNNGRYHHHVALADVSDAFNVTGTAVSKVRRRMIPVISELGLQYSTHGMKKMECIV